VLDSLTGRERRVLQLRFGLETAEPARSRRSQGLPRDARADRQIERSAA